VALSPSIPTSFVPKQPVSTDRRRFSSGGNNLFLIIAGVALGLTVAVAVATFLYDQLLKNEESAKAAQIVAAQKSVNEDTVNQLVRLQSRLNDSETLINQHIVLTQFFNLLGSITSQTVHFDGVKIQVADDRSAHITMTGEATDFNALASESNTFASEQYIKSAIFSNINVNKDNNVSFTLDADLDPALVVESAPISQVAVPAFTNSTATSTDTNTSAP
jgi:hypothetical protein